MSFSNVHVLLLYAYVSLYTLLPPLTLKYEHSKHHPRGRIITHSLTLDRIPLPTGFDGF